MNRFLAAATVAAAFVLTGATASLACIVEENAQQGTFKGESCAVSKTAACSQLVGLNKATDASAGVVLQQAVEADVCGKQATLIVMLCSQSQAVILGTDNYYNEVPYLDLVNPGSVKAMEGWVQQALHDKTALSPELLMAEAQRRGLNDTMTLPVSGKI